jgi:plastocyanin
VHRIWIVAVAALVALVAGVAAGVALARTASVGVRKTGTRYHFTSGQVHINRGDTVVWHWRAPRTQLHNVTVTSGPQRFHSRTSSRLTFRHRFTRPGLYRIVCTIHRLQGQRMLVLVH